MSKAIELVNEFISKRDIVSYKGLGLQHIGKHPDMIAFDKARDELYEYINKIEKNYVERS